ncbi:MAG: DUF4271 domain-containing protein [Prevotellaceae bacterium]|jgi:hypothetical protein|nr:DUF4271 domain-containing protein [Prevotellaceae bacterium]
MSVTSDYILATQTYNKNCIGEDMQLYVNFNTDIYSSKIISSPKIFGNKSELLHTSMIAKMPTDINIPDKETTSWIVSGLLIFYIIMLILSKRYIPILGLILFSNKDKNITYHNLAYGFAQTANLLVVFSVVILSIFFYLLEKPVYITNQTPLKLFAFIAIAVCLYIVFKLTTIKIIGYISENEELKSKMFSIEIIILSTYGLFSGFFLSLCFLNPIQNANIWLAVISAIIILIQLLKISKLTMIFIDEKISPFFLILYLCTFEILPTWLIIDFL